MFLPLHHIQVQRKPLPPKKPPISWNIEIARVEAETDGPTCPFKADNDCVP